MVSVSLFSVQGFLVSPLDTDIPSPVSEIILSLSGGVLNILVSNHFLTFSALSIDNSLFLAAESVPWLLAYPLTITLQVLHLFFKYNSKSLWYSGSLHDL